MQKVADDLGALECALPAEAVQELEAATGFTLGFPAEFMAETVRLR